MKIIFTLLTIILFSSNTIFSQQYYDFGFTRSSQIMVNDSLGNELRFPWVGGLNAIHLQEIDLDLDGQLDLVSFDIHGNRLLTFINNGSTNSFPYTYAPEYEKYFPKISSWMQTLDYDRDGDMDIFCYSNYGAGISVFRNVSANGQLKFELLSSTLYYSIPNWPPTNLYVSSVDYPAIVDVDNDGDVDILTFSILGTFVYYYRNYSMEKYNVPDSLEFMLYDKCWGKFAESENNNSVLLDQNCGYTANKSESKNGLKHTGSTLLAVDLNNDTLLDLILGDVDYFTVNKLTNGGTLDSAHMISQDTTFPINTRYINTISFPVVKYIDIDNDGINELIASPFEGAYYKPENSNSVWLYENSGTNAQPIFNFEQEDFLQGEMIDVGDGSKPRLVDVNNDGLLDLIISNYGYVDSSYMDSVWYILHTHKISQLTYYKNIGSNGNPKYQFMENDWAGLSALDRISISPTFGDIDGDGDDDMIVGCNKGNLIFYENIAAAGQPISFAAPVMNYQGITVGPENFSTPQLIDINGDSLLDLVIGKKTNRLQNISMLDSIVGYISYYKNTGSKTQAIFTLETDSMGNVDPSDYWNYYSAYSSPYFFRDSNDSLKLFVGSASGITFYYNNIENNIHGTFGIDSNMVYKDQVQTLYSAFSYINEDLNLVPYQSGMHSAPLVHDFDNDGFFDIMIGNFSGGLTYFKGIQPPGVGTENAKQITNPDIQLYPNPADDYVNLNIDKYQDLQVLNIEIRDMTGRLISSKQSLANKTTRLNTASLKQGVYFVTVNSRSYSGQTFSRTLKLMVL